tara:strand:+ start:655 stop:951 length:297 start_codon:yes stop_codon:yes gene_type:complete
MTSFPSHILRFSGEKKASRKERSQFLMGKVCLFACAGVYGFLHACIHQRVLERKSKELWTGRFDLLLCLASAFFMGRDLVQAVSSLADGFIFLPAVSG